MRWRTALRAAAARRSRCPRCRRNRASILPAPGEAAERARLARLGFRAAGPQMLRVDMAERIARHAHEARAGKEASVVDDALATSLGPVAGEALARLMRDIGFRPSSSEAGWIWQGRGRPPGQADARHPAHAFAALGGVRSVAEGASCGSTSSSGSRGS